MATTARETRPATALPPLVLVLAVLACAPLAGHLPAWTLLFAGTLLSGRMLATHKGLAPARLTLKLGLAVAAIALTYGQFHTLRGARPGFSFFVALFGLKLLEADNERDFVVIILLCYIALLGGLVFVQSFAMAIYALAFLVLSFTVLGTVTQPLGPTAPERVRLVLGLLVRALPLALIAYFLFPRLDGGLWGGPVNGRGATTGISRVLRPGAFTRLIPSRQVAFRAIFPTGRVPNRTQRYFRVYVMSRTNGRSWRRSPMPHAIETGPPPSAITRYTVLLQATGRRALPALDWPLPQPGLKLASGDLLRATRPVNHLIRYVAKASRLPRETLPAAERAQDLALPRDLDPRILSLAHHLGGNGRPSAERVQRTLHYFISHHFVYSLTPPPMGQDPLARFLFTVRRGYCSDYAAAFATLMRAEGVPSRVVVGYAGGTFNPIGHDVIIRARDAHAWTEVWIRSRWLRVDPTMVVAPAVIDYGVSAVARLAAQGRSQFPANRSALHRLLDGSPWRRARYHWMLWHDAFTTAWDNWVIDYNWHRQEHMLQHLGWRDVHRLWLAVLLAALLPVTIVLLKTLGAVSGRRDPTSALYAAFERKLARIGIPRRACEGPNDYAQRVISGRPDLATAVRSITETYVRIRYADHHWEFRRMRNAVRRFRPSVRH